MDGRRRLWRRGPAPKAQRASAREGSEHSRRLHQIEKAALAAAFVFVDPPGKRIQHPIATSGSLVEKTGITPATVNKALGHLEQLGIVKELTARKRNRLFSYAGYIEIMSRGTELPAF